MAVFWGGSLLLQCSKQSLLSTQDLNGGGWKLGKVRQTTCMCQEFGSELQVNTSYILSDKTGEVGSNSLHLVPHEALQTGLEIKV